MANMEDVLDLYDEPYDSRRPVVCFDETSTQLLAETRPSLPPRPGIPLRQDYEYRREGVRNLFLACEPLAGWRHVAVTQRRTMEDFAHQMRWLVDEAYPETPVVRVVMDNLNTHRPASLYETFPAPEARRIAKRLEFHYTPKHGSWLNMAEIEFSVLSRSCLKLVEHGGNRVQRTSTQATAKSPNRLAEGRSKAIGKINGSPARRRSGGKCKPWLRSATPPAPPSTGGSTPKTPVPNSTAFTLLIPRLTEY